MFSITISNAVFIYILHGCLLMPSSIQALLQLQDLKVQQYNYRYVHHQPISMITSTTKKRKIVVPSAFYVTRHHHHQQQQQQQQQQQRKYYTSHVQRWAAIGNNENDDNNTIDTISNNENVSTKQLQDNLEEDKEEIEALKQELITYLQLRKDIGADDIAKEQIGKVIGGTKGNPILDFVSLSPNKPSITIDVSNPLDYDELTKYGYGHLITRIMKIGGRNKMYDILNLEKPMIKSKTLYTSSNNNTIIIDRVGQRYSGLKLNQILDDTIQGEALINVQKKLQNGEKLTVSPQILIDEIESYTIPFSDKRNVGPKQTPDWTVEQIDAWGKQQGKVESWARNNKLNSYMIDPMENLDTITIQQRLFSIITSFITAIAFGKATIPLKQLLIKYNVMDDITSSDQLSVLATILQSTSILLVLISFVSGMYCSKVAIDKNRSSYIWFIKGIIGGPFTIQQFQSLSTRITQQEWNDQQKENELLKL